MFERGKFGRYGRIDIEVLEFEVGELLFELPKPGGRIGGGGAGSNNCGDGIERMNILKQLLEFAKRGGAGDGGL
jgi:hypothetical protein